MPAPTAALLLVQRNANNRTWLHKERHAEALKKGDGEAGEGGAAREQAECGENANILGRL